MEALENSVSMYPALEGRFPQVSAIEMEFDPKLPRMKRIKYAHVNGEPLDPNRSYKLVSRGYMGRGKDGFDSLLVKSEGGYCEEIVSEENGVLISTILRQYFMSLKVLGKWNLWSKSLGRCFGRIHEEVHSHHPVVEPKPPSKDAVEAFREAARKYPSRKGADDTVLDEDDDSNEIKPVPTQVTEQERELVLMRKVMRKWWRLAGLRGHPSLCDEMGDGEFMVNWTKVSWLHLTADNMANLKD
jgi:5'-nucleotidase